VLRNFGQGSVAENSGIVVQAHETPRGLQANEVLEITPPDPELEAARNPGIDSRRAGGCTVPRRPRQMVRQGQRVWVCQRLRAI
jgi:hypothetical protein